MDGVTEILALLKTLLEMGWPGIVLVFLVILWRRTIALEEQLHDCLKVDKEPKSPA